MMRKVSLRHPGSSHGSSPGSALGSPRGSPPVSSPGSLHGSSHGSPTGSSPGSLHGSSPGSSYFSWHGSSPGSSHCSLHGSSPGSSHGSAGAPFNKVESICPVSLIKGKKLKKIILCGSLKDRNHNHKKSACVESHMSIKKAMSCWLIFREQKMTSPPAPLCPIIRIAYWV